MNPIKFFILFLTAWGMFYIGYCQETELIRKIEIAGITDASCDGYGFLYVANTRGDIFKYNKAGELLLSYSSDNVSPISSLDVSKQSKIFGFYKSEQSYIILDRFLNQLSKSFLISELIMQASETAFSADNNVWFYDEFNFSLKNFNLQTNVLQNSINLSLSISEREWDIIQIIDYQNKLFLYNRNKNTYVLDNNGNLISFLPVKPDSKFSLFENKLYFNEGNELKSIDIYSFEISETVTTLTKADFQKLIVQKDFLFLVKNNAVEIYTFRKD